MAFPFWTAVCSLCKRIPQCPNWKLPSQCPHLAALGLHPRSSTRDLAITLRGDKIGFPCRKKYLKVGMCPSFFNSWGKTSDGSSCAMWASVSWACWAKHSGGHYSAGRLALATALQSCHKGFSVRHLTQQAHSYVCRGFPWKPCKL